MRFVDRNSVDPPPSLSGPKASVAAERAAAIEYYKPGVLTPAYGFSEYKADPDVLAALGQLFHLKCAYCQSPVGAVNNEEIEHYRPKGGIDGVDDHPGYWWLASEWSNLLLSCTGCNQWRRQNIVGEDTTEEELLKLLATRGRKSYGKLQQFPIAGVRATAASPDLDLEDARLIDPTCRDPAPELRWSVSKQVSVVLPALKNNGPSAYGEVTIHVCALNRAKLVKERTGLLQQLRLFRTTLLSLLQRDSSPAGVAAADAIVQLMNSFTLPDRPYSAMAEAYVAEVRAELTRWLEKRRAEAA